MGAGYKQTYLPRVYPMVPPHLHMVSPQHPHHPLKHVQVGAGLLTVYSPTHHNYTIQYFMGCPRLHSQHNLLFLHLQKPIILHSRGQWTQSVRIKWLGTAGCWAGGTLSGSNCTLFITTLCRIIAALQKHPGHLQHLQCFYCEAQGKGRAKGRPRKVTQRSFIDCRLYIILYFPDALH